MNDNDLITIPETFYGYWQIITTERFEDNKIILGGYSVHYDLNHKETHRTKNTDNVILYF